MTKAKKSTVTRSRTTDWQVGQPLAFPSRESFERAAREAVEEGIRGPFKTKRGKKKKK